MVAFSNHTRRMMTVGAAAILVVLMIYVICYMQLRNRGLHEMKPYDSDGFLYDSVDRVFQTHDLSTHHFRQWIFAPVNFVDQQVFGGPQPVLCMMFDLS